MKNNLDDNCSVCDLVKPELNIATQISSMVADINLLTKNDASFPNIKTKNASNPKPWLTTGIKIYKAKKGNYI
jgi:hypothetical protein